MVATLAVPVVTNKRRWCRPAVARTVVGSICPHPCKKESADIKLSKPRRTVGLVCDANGVAPHVLTALPSVCSQRDTIEVPPVDILTFLES